MTLNSTYRCMENPDLVSASEPAALITTNLGCKSIPRETPPLFLPK